MTKENQPSGPVFWDIETSGRELDEIIPLAPKFRAPSNYKDEAKIQAHIDDQRAEWLKGAALSAVTGKVLCIGLLQGEKFVCLGVNGDSEKQIIEQFWWAFDTNLVSYVGFAIKHFDLPFLVRRSYALKIAVPHGVREGRYWGFRFSDVQDQWTFGDKQELISLDRLARYLGLGQKLGDGADFAGLWAASREAALDYLKNDLALTQACAARMDGIDCQTMVRSEDTDQLL